MGTVALTLKRGAAQREADILLFAVDPTYIGQILNTSSLLGWMRPFAPALPRSNRIASEMHLGTNQIAPLRVADDLGTTSARLSHIFVDQQGWQTTSPQTSGLDPSAQDIKK